ncbi:hypothetical protein NP05227_04430 [Helicobacter pylori]
MHKIERLLQTLAPKGVEFKKIGEICLIKRGRVIAKKILQENGKYPVYSSQTLNNGILGFIDTYDFDGEFLTWTTDGAYAGSVFYRKGRFSITNVCGLLQVIQDNILHKYLYYILQITAPLHVSSGMGNPKLMSAAMQQIQIPIPPLEVQQEIVKILDAFTELNTELKARKKQYQYYQNMLLDFNGIHSNHQDAKIKPYPKRLKTLLQTLAPKGVEFKTLEEIFEIKNGYTPSKKNPEFWEKGTIPWFRMEDIRENGRILKDSIQHITPKALKGKKLFPKNSIIISTTATIGEHALLIVDSLANQQFTFLSKKANCNLALDMKFFFYQCFLLGEWCKNNTNVSGFASVDMTAFKKYKFPIPPLEIQQEIVKILDQFSLLTTDLLAGIPAEIKARKKQYEYYREKLLTFKPLTPHKEVKK